MACTILVGWGKKANSLQKFVGLLNYINNVCILKFVITDQSQIIIMVFNEIKIRAYWNYSVMLRYLIFHTAHHDTVHNILAVKYYNCYLVGKTLYYFHTTVHMLLFWMIIPTQITSPISVFLVFQYMVVCCRQKTVLGR
jgi:hypothetical protein